MYYDSTTIIKFRSSDGSFDRLCLVYDKLQENTISAIKEEFIKISKEKPTVHYCDIINEVMGNYGYDFELPKVKTIHF